ncbi:hypothetical protein ACFWI0_04310 [[Kitasatospora] papulosa]
MSFVSPATTYNPPLPVTVAARAVATFLPADPETAAALRAAH